MMTTAKKIDEKIEQIRKVPRSQIVQTEAPKKTPTAAQALDKEKRKTIDQPFVT